MTNGGLLTTRSNVSPRTGSSRSPSLRSTGTPDSAAVSPASCSARAETSVATTSRECRAACSACTPLPVPTSRVRPTGAGGVSWARVVEAPPTPSTCSAGSGPAAPSRPVPRSETTHQRSAPAAVAVRTNVQPWVHLGAVGVEHPEVHRGIQRQGPARGLLRHRQLQQEQPDQGVQGVAAGGCPPGGHGLAPAQRLGGDRTEAAGHTVNGEAGRDEGVPEEIRPGRGRPRPSPRRPRCSCAWRTPLPRR